MRSRARKREIDVYDRRLEAISAAAELGSFSRAAAKLRVSTPALVKQVSGFEAEFGITLFERSHSGVKVTPAGALLVDDARSIMRQSEDALRRARRAAGDGGAVRLGVSMMCPGRQTLSMWTGIHDLEPSLRFEIVPVSDLYDERETVMRSLGREVDVVQSSFSTPRWGDACQKLRIVNVPFYIDLPRTSPLARKTRITVADLEGMRLRVLRHGNDAMDSLRIDLLADGGVDVIDVDSFDFALFNEAEEKGDAVLTCGAWSGCTRPLWACRSCADARCRSFCTTRSSQLSKYKNSSTPWLSFSNSSFGTGLFDYFCRPYKTRPWPNGQGLTTSF